MDYFSRWRRLKVRYVDRAKVSRPSCLDLDNTSSLAYQELKKNLENKNKQFSVYSDESVKLALETLFHGKCAYCESRYVVTQPMDVEHFRPKGNASGYWWLAAVWENLLPSCIDCNRWRKQIRYNYKTTKRDDKKITSGKQHRFPLVCSSTVAKAPTNSFKVNNAKILETIQLESPLLLNPTKDKVDSWFRYSSQGVASPSKDVMEDGTKLMRVDKTIDIIGLNRMQLVSSRKEVILQLECLIFTVEKLTVLLHDAGLAYNYKEAIHDLLVYLFKHIQSYQNPKNPYSVMCKEMIKKRLGKIIQ